MPYPVQVDHEFSRRWVTRSIWGTLGAALGFGLLWIDVRYGTSGIGLALGLLSFLVTVLKIAWDEHRILDHYHCPSCGKPLDGPKTDIHHPRLKDAVMFDCNDCEITWDTKLRNGD